MEESTHKAAWYQNLLEAHIDKSFGLHWPKGGVCIQSQMHHGNQKCGPDDWDVQDTEHGLRAVRSEIKCASKMYDDKKVTAKHKCWRPWIINRGKREDHNTNRRPSRIMANSYWWVRRDSQVWISWDTTCMYLWPSYLAALHNALA